MADRGLCSYAHLALLVQAGVHAVLRVGARQMVDFTPGRPCVRPSVRRTPAVKGIPRSRWLQARGIHNQLDGAIDRATGARGVILQVARLTVVHAAAVDVVGGYYITHRHAASFRYHVTHDGRQWTVATAHLLWRAKAPHAPRTEGTRDVGR